MGDAKRDQIAGAGTRGSNKYASLFHESSLGRLYMFGMHSHLAVPHVLCFMINVGGLIVLFKVYPPRSNPFLSEHC